MDRKFKVHGLRWTFELSSVTASSSSLDISKLHVWVSDVKFSSFHRS